MKISNKSIKNKHYKVIESNIQKNYTKNEYVKLGDRLRKYNLNDNSLPNDDLEILQTLRTSYKEPLSEIFEILQKSIKKINKNAIITYRVKRIDSIISKLKRLPDAQLPRIEDIAGCRCILKNNEQVYKLKEILGNELFIKSDRNDYIKNPKPDGYKSLHLIVQLKNKESRPIEIQLRCEKDHNWATLVEITDLVYNTKIKEMGNSPELGEMLFFLSKGFENLSKSDLCRLINLIDKTDFIKKINSVFVNNSINVRKQWSEIERKSDSSFYLIEVDNQNNPRITSYRYFNEAEKAYFEKFKKKQNHNIVLTHIPNAKFDQISKAYSNYTLTYHDFFQDFLAKLEELVKTSLRESKISDFIKYFSLFSYVFFEVAIRQVYEIYSLEKTQCKSLKKIEWQKDINIRLKKIVDKKHSIFFDVNSSRLKISHLIINYKRKKIWKHYSSIFRSEVTKIGRELT